MCENKFSAKHQKPCTHIEQTQRKNNFWFHQVKSKFYTKQCTREGYTIKTGNDCNKRFRKINDPSLIQAVQENYIRLISQKISNQIYIAFIKTPINKPKELYSYRHQSDAWIPREVANIPNIHTLFYSVTYPLLCPHIIYISWFIWNSIFTFCYFWFILFLLKEKFLFFYLKEREQKKTENI